MLETIEVRPSATASPLDPREERIALLERVLDEQRAAHAKVVYDLTRELDRRVAQINGLEYERRFGKALLMIVVPRLKRSALLHRVFPHATRVKVVAALKRFGL